MKPLDMTRHHADNCHSEHAAWDPEGNLIVAIGVGPIPKRGKYAPGDWVVVHGRPNAVRGNRRYGFRGMVLGGCGGGYYYGITDDGRQWWETGGVLVPESNPSPESCTCCPHPAPKATPVVSRQLDLLSPAAFFASTARAVS
ncbi:hypothetical protein [Micromonospora sp. NPDC005324]|uniref:hypothetical protein n=1 Tax=Micromonospora sp. NPDC005324 TaxID=3157033 RepID=UPI0033A16846